MQDVVEINGEKYRKIESSGSKQILILQRGWVVVGDVSQDGDMLSVHNAAVIRIWGTDKGLGQIAENGPTSKTKLDRCPPLHIHILTTVARMDCNEDNWDG